MRYILIKENGIEELPRRTDFLIDFLIQEYPQTYWRFKGYHLVQNLML